MVRQSRGALTGAASPVRRMFARLDGALRGLALGMIRGYQYALSPLFPGACRFWPSCSEYAAESFRRFHFLRALRLTAARILKCNPWHPGGEDPPPEK